MGGSSFGAMHIINAGCFGCLCLVPSPGSLIESPPGHYTGQSHTLHCFIAYPSFLIQSWKMAYTSVLKEVICPREDRVPYAPNPCASLMQLTMEERKQSMGRLLVKIRARPIALIPDDD
jgi:hypothetical protein